MVNNYKRKTNRQSWDENSMKNAIIKVATGAIGLNKASILYNVPKATLKRRLTKYNYTKDIDKAIEKKMGSFNQVFTKKQETELASYVKLMENFFGLTTKDLRTLAYNLAERNNLKHNFDDSTKMAGRIWLENFPKRNQDLSLRKPEPTSAARAAGFNQVAVNKFFDLLTEVVDTYKLTPDRIFNVDETGITTVPKSLPRIIGTKGKKQVDLLTSAERGQLVTTVFCFGADGSYMPPLFIFPRKRMKPDLMNNAPRGSWAECHESGWIQKDIFTSWFKKFITFSRASIDHPVLLLLDGHASHTKNLDIINLGREHGVHILSFPPHCTHRLQPLDVGFMKPLSTYYTEAAQMWLRTNSGRVITQFQIAELVGKAFQKMATMSTAFNAFQATGIWPLDRSVFTKTDFLAAATTEIELPRSSSVLVTSAKSERETDMEVSNIDEPQPSTSGINNISIPKNHDAHTNSFNVGPEDIMPFPKTTKMKRSNAKRGKTAILTSSPYRQEIESSQIIQTQRVKKVLNVDNKKSKKNKGKATKKSDIKRSKRKRDDSSSKDEEDDPQCLYCTHLFSESNEEWVQCPICHLWAHCDCAGIEEDDDEVIFVCERCRT